MAVEQDLNAIAFPTLSEEQLAQLGRYAGAPARRVRRWRCALRLSQARGLAVGEGSMSVQFVHEFLKGM